MSRRLRALAGPVLRSVLAAAVLLVASAPGMGAAVKEVLDNGLVVITSPAAAGSVVAVEVLIKASALDEPPGKAGLRQLLQQTLARGSENMSGDDLAAALDDLGVDFDTGLGLDYVEAYVVCLSQDLERAMALLAEVVRRPVFPAKELETQREVARRHLRSLRADPLQTAAQLVRQGLFEGHPYSVPIQGTEDSLAVITRADLVGFHQRHYSPGNTIIAVAGGIARDAALAAVRRAFGDWRGAPVPAIAAPPVQPLERSALQVREAPVGQAYFMLGYPAGKPRPETFCEMEVIRVLLGRGMGARLFGALRDRAAVAYEAEASYVALAHGGYLAAYVATAPRDLERTKQLLRAECERLRDEPVAASELERARQSAVGAHALAHQKTKDRAFHLAWYEAIGLGYDFDARYAEAMTSVTAERVQAAARAHFNHYCLGLVLPGR
jgi:predicted Zn-dependent peptidase